MENKRKGNLEMSFVGLMKSHKGIVAFGDGKSSLQDSFGNYYEENGRQVQKVYKCERFIFVTFGANKYIKNNSEVNLEILLNSILENHNGNAKQFFQEINNEMEETFSKWPTEQYHFIYGEKNQGEYLLFSIIMDMNGIHYENIIKTIDHIFCISPMMPTALTIDSNATVIEMKKQAEVLMNSVIILGNTFLKYNPVGGKIIIETFE